MIDEVGQHVARSGDKIEDLRATVEEFGKVGKNLLKAKKIVAPVWIIVTSQEKLDEVVAAIDSKRVELAKLQDRFRYRVDLAPSDIREVATKRVLAKKPEAIPILKKLLCRESGVVECRPASGKNDSPYGHHGGGFRQFLSVSSVLHRPLHRHHVGHSASAWCASALRRQQPHDHQASL